jgi:hypothetical protein
VAQLSREEFDSIEFGAARTGEHRDAALRMSQLASAGTAEAGGMSTAEAHLRAGEQWLLADDPTAAADGFRRALDMAKGEGEAGGGTFTDARVSLARALFLLGQADEAGRLVGQLEAAGRDNPRTCDLVAELLFEQSDLIGALDWANSGVELCLAAAGLPAPAASAAGDTANGRADDPAPIILPEHLPPAVDRTELRMLLSLRYRIRNDMGLDEDAYDKLLDDF